MDPGKSVAATVRYECRIKSGPFRIAIEGETFERSAGQDMMVLVRIATVRRSVVEETVVGVIGTAYRGEGLETVRLLRFMNEGGVIGLSPDLVI